MGILLIYQARVLSMKPTLPASLIFNFVGQVRPAVVEKLTFPGETRERESFVFEKSDFPTSPRDSDEK